MAGADHAAEGTHHAAEGGLLKRLRSRRVAVASHLLDGGLRDFLEAFLAHHAAGGLERGPPRGVAEAGDLLRRGAASLLAPETENTLHAAQVLDGADGERTAVLGPGVIHPLLALRVTDLAQRRKARHGGLG